MNTDLITTIFGAVAAVCTAVVTIVHASGSPTMTVAGLLGAVAMAILGWFTNKPSTK